MAKIKNNKLSKKLASSIEKAYGITTGDKYFCVEKDVLNLKLDYSSSNILSGWRINFISNLICFEGIDIHGEPSGSVNSLEVGDYQFFINGTLATIPIVESDFFPIYSQGNGTNNNIGMYFLNYSEYKIANTTSILRYYFSLAYVDLGNFNHIQNISNPQIPVLKVEIHKGTAANPQGTNAHPSILIAPPCPPIWRPGWGGLAH